MIANGSKKIRIRTDRYGRLEFNIYAVVWGILFLLPPAHQVYEVMVGALPSFQWQMVGNAYRTFGFLFGLFLINDLVLLPQLFAKKRRILYFVCVTALLVVIWYTCQPARISPPPPPMNPQMPHRPLNMAKITTMIGCLCVIFGNMNIKLYLNALRREDALHDIKSEQTRSELDALRYQLNPHFLMNTLNNIQALATISEEKTVETVQQLSGMMRYMLYETRVHKVPLGKEVDFVKNFMSLMKIRYSDNVQISFRQPDKLNCEVPPLLFISFVENAFKHGISYRGISRIEVAMEIKGDELVFTCINSVPESHAEKHEHGIGLENVKRRLQLLYPGRKVLDIKEEGNEFKVKLTIPLNEYD